MQVGSPGENLDGRLRGFVKQEFRAPIEIVLLAGVHARGALVLAHGFEGIAHALVEIA